MMSVPPRTHLLEITVNAKLCILLAASVLALSACKNDTPEAQQQADQASAAASQAGDAAANAAQAAGDAAKQGVDAAAWRM